MSIGTAELEVRKGVWAKLNADSTLVTTMGAKIYQRVPEDAALPYVSIWTGNADPMDTFGRIGRTLTMRLHVFSEKVDDDEAYLIADRADELLDYATDITATGYTVISISLEDAQSFQQKEYVRIAMDYKVRVEE